MTRIIQASMETLCIGNKTEAKILKPDENGLYETPMAVFNVPSRNGSLYEAESIKKEFMGPSTFNTKLTSGQLYGEADHPSLYEFNPNDAHYEQAIVDRLSQVVQAKRSHRFDSFRLVDMEDNSVVCYGKYKPCLPLGNILQEALDDPRANPSFSLRSFTELFEDPSGKYPRGVELKRTKKCITYDYVDTGGFAFACKANSISRENLQVDLRVSKLEQLVLSGYSSESISNSEINDLFKSNDIKVDKRIVSIIDDPHGRIKRIHGTKSFESFALNLF